MTDDGDHVEALVAELMMDLETGVGPEVPGTLWAMTPAEVRERTIGLLTITYTAVHEAKPENLSAFAAGLAADVPEQLGSYDLGLDLPLPPEDHDCRRIVEMAADMAATLVAQQAHERLVVVASTLLAAFGMVCHEYEAACPDAAILPILQELAALPAASED